MIKTKLNKIKKNKKNETRKLKNHKTDKFKFRTYTNLSNVKHQKYIDIQNTQHINDIDKNEIVFIFLRLLNQIKIYHWNTYSYSQHKATDKLYDALNESFDKFVEVMLGKMDKRILFKNNFQNIVINNLYDLQHLKFELNNFKNVLISLNNNANFNGVINSDLLNIRDEILAIINQHLYLLSLHR